MHVFILVCVLKTSSIINRLLVFAKYMRQVLPLYSTNKVIDRLALKCDITESYLNRDLI